MSARFERCDTAWSRGRLDQRAGPGKVLFGRMYEDAQIEDAAFKPGSRILSIASAGCTAIALSRQHHVTAVDINPVQLEYARQRNDGSPARRGLVERVMAATRTMAPAVGWTEARLAAFLDLEDPVEQMRFWHQHLNTLRFQLSFDRLMSLTMLKSVYAPPFLHFLPARFGAVLRGRMERCFALHSNRTNPYARALLLGELPRDRAPTNATGIVFIEGDVADFLQEESPASYDGFTLSNILDGATEMFQRRLLQGLERAAAPGAVVVLRSFREPQRPTSDNLAALDRSMLWGVVEALPLSSSSLFIRNPS